MDAYKEFFLNMRDSMGENTKIFDVRKDRKFSIKP